jgi:hypothetical protein
MRLIGVSFSEMAHNLRMSVKLVAALFNTSKLIDSGGSSGWLKHRA